MNTATGRPGSIRNNYITYVFGDRHQRIWVGTAIGLDRYDPAKDQFVHYPGENNNPDSGVTSHLVNSMDEDAEGNMWIGTENDGLIILNPATNSVYHYRHDDVDPASLSTNSLWSIYMDSKKNMWIGSFTGGIDFVNRDARKFIHYKHNSSPYSLSSNQVLCLYGGFAAEPMDRHGWGRPQSHGPEDGPVPAFSAYPGESEHDRRELCVEGDRGQQG